MTESGSFAAISPAVVFGIGIVMVLALLWLIVGWVRRFWPTLIRMARALGDKFGQTALVRNMRLRFPRTTGFLAARLDTARFLGLTASVLALLFVYVLVLYLDSVYDFLGGAGVVAGDTRLANLLFALRNPVMISVFGRITALGGWEVVVTMLAGVSLALILGRRFALLAGLWITVVGNQISVRLLKGFFDRPRSGLGYFVESSGSFPSGHAASSVAVWGMMFYVLWRMRILSSSVAGLGALSVAFLIGLSRIYLIEHYLSDVLNGYLVGAMWLTIGIGFCEWRRDRGLRSMAPANGLARVVVGGALAVSVVLAFALASPLSEALPPRETAVFVPGAPLPPPDDFPRDTQSLFGAPRQPVNIVVPAQDAARLVRILVGGGWVAADTPGLWTLVDGVWSDWTGTPLPRPLILPVFWNNRPNDLGFARAEAGDPVRLHLRLWDSGFRDGDAIIFVGTLSLEDPLDWVETQSEGTNARLADALAELNRLLDAEGIQALGLERR